MNFKVKTLTLCLIAAILPSENAIFASNPTSGQEKNSHDLEIYAPAAGMLILTGGLNILGVDGRSDFAQLLTAGAGSLVLTAGVTQGLKHSISRERPDGTDFDSFPSGHTAMSFMSATILSKEYGSYSPWISVASYGIASAVAVQRVAADRHYATDVLAGAAIGICSVQASYWLTDRIFKKNSAKFAISIPGHGVQATIGFKL